jgi:hypothetical protein
MFTMNGDDREHPLPVAALPEVERQQRQHRHDVGRGLVVVVGVRAADLDETAAGEARVEVGVHAPGQRPDDERHHDPLILLVVGHDADDQAIEERQLRQRHDIVAAADRIDREQPRHDDGDPEEHQEPLRRAVAEDRAREERPRVQRVGGEEDQRHQQRPAERRQLIAPPPERRMVVVVPQVDEEAEDRFVQAERRPGYEPDDPDQCSLRHRETALLKGEPTWRTDTRVQRRRPGVRALPGGRSAIQ